jgi:hypothetical protein
MAKFSERIGAQAPRVVIQVSDLDHATRTALWNSFHSTVTDMNRRGYEYNGTRPGNALLRTMWADELELPIDEFSTDSAITVTKNLYLKKEWWKVLDHVQWMAGAVGGYWANLAGAYRAAVESDLQRYLVGYRFLGDELIPVSNEAEMLEVRNAMSGAGSNARVHLERATSLLASREDPQYAKVVHESINAVESTVAELTGQAVLSAGLKQLEQKGVPTHKALLGAWDKLYGYTSDAGGIRHGLVRDEEVDEPLAVYFLVTCSAFINMLLKIAGSPPATT